MWPPIEDSFGIYFNETIASSITSYRIPAIVPYMEDAITKLTTNPDEATWMCGRYAANVMCTLESNDSPFGAKSDIMFLQGVETDPFTSKNTSIHSSSLLHMHNVKKCAKLNGGFVKSIWERLTFSRPQTENEDIGEVDVDIFAWSWNVFKFKGGMAGPIYEM